MKEHCSYVHKNNVLRVVFLLCFSSQFIMYRLVIELASPDPHIGILNTAVMINGYLCVESS